MSALPAVVKTLVVLGVISLAMRLVRAHEAARSRLPGDPSPEDPDDPDEPTVLAPEAEPAGGLVLTEGDVTVLQTFNFSHEADLVRAYLESEAIPSVVEHDQAPLSGVMPVTVWVARKDLEAARRILEEIPEDTGHLPWEGSDDTTRE